MFSFAVQIVAVIKLSCEERIGKSKWTERSLNSRSMAAQYPGIYLLMLGRKNQALKRRKSEAVLNSLFH